MSERLLNATRARIDPRKLRDYALNPEHITGRHKAVFFGQMGYTAENWRVLERDIREQHLSQPVEAGRPSPYGNKYTVTAPLTGPNGEVRSVTTVWIFKIGNDYADLVTIEPAGKQQET